MQGNTGSKLDYPEESVPLNLISQEAKKNYFHFNRINCERVIRHLPKVLKALIYSRMNKPNHAFLNIPHSNEKLYQLNVANPFTTIFIELKSLIMSCRLAMPSVRFSKNCANQ